MTYELKSQEYLCVYFVVTVLSSKGHRLKHTVFLSVDSERVGGRQVLSTGSKGLDMWIQRDISEATWDGPAKPLAVSLQRKTVMLSSPRPSSPELGRQALGHIF